MGTLTTIKDENKLLVAASDLFAAMGKKQASGDRKDAQDSFRSWLADRITSFDMEEGFDFFIYLNAASIREMLKYESAPAEVKTFFDNYEQYA
ncbi:MAG: hypothetical protein LBB62_05145 [Proteiniphilum sp.]|jgi:hypothetical protein|nr:hypothetical protein [Proteiniphilum sp.]